MTSARPQMPAIAVVGLGALTPGATDVAGFWQNVVTGRDLITDVPATHWRIDDYYDPDPTAEDRTYGRRGAFLPEIDFDPTVFGIPPATLPGTDTTQLLALHVARQVLADAGVLGGEASARERVSVILGTGALELMQTMSNRMQRPVWRRALESAGYPDDQVADVCDRIADQYVHWQEATFPGLLSNVVAGRIANRFDLHGSNYTTDAACAGSLAAVASAVSELALGTADLVVTGGVDTLNDILMYMCFSKTPALSKSGDCRPFSDAADGTLLGEALVMFALKRLADAERDGDRVHAVLRGIGSSSDGRGQSIYAPVPEGQARALRRAYESAGYGPDTVELVEAHGTGTQAGDAAEFSALRTVFDASLRGDRQWCALGTVKSQIGHTKSAAGAAGMLKAVLALQHKILPPTIKVVRANPELDLPSSPFYLNTQARPWVSGATHPRRASVSSFGFGGTNFHLTLEEYVPADGSSGTPPGRLRTMPNELVLLGADSTEALLDLTDALVKDTRPLTRIAHESQISFRGSDPVRLAVVAVDVADLAAQLGRLRGLVEAAPGRRVSTPGGLVFDPRPANPGRVAVLFSGQGAQYPGMGAELAIHFGEALDVWDRASGIGLSDRPLHTVALPKPAFTQEERDAQRELLNRTEWAQPALAVQSVALLAVLQSAGLKPDCLGGHSFGELVALHASGVVSEADLYRLARRRGELMAAATRKPGAMLAVSSDEPGLEPFLREYAERVWLANYNSPRQIVLSGEADAIEELGARLAENGVAVRRLAASGAFHTPLLAAAREPFREALNGCALAPMNIDVYANLDADLHPADPELLRERLVDHLVSPVRFADQVEAMYDGGVRTFLEVGAGAALTGLVGDVLGEREHLAVSADQAGGGVAALQRALGQLAVAGVPLNLGSLWHADWSVPVAEEEQRKMVLKLSGANYGRPGPPAYRPVTSDVPTAPRPLASGALDEQQEPLADAPSVTPELLPAAQASRSPRPTPGFAEAQRQFVDAHTEYQRLMAEAHMAFLRTSEGWWPGTAGGGAATTLPSPALAPQTEDAAPSSWGSAPRDWHTPVAPGFAPAAARTMAPSPTGPEPARPEIEQAVPPTVPADAESVADVLFSVVAERTGYPIEILEPHMDLEADLGIDSIKRVEILAKLRKRIPALVDLEARDIVRLRTLGQISEHLGSPVATTTETAPAETAPSRSVTLVVPAPPLSGLEIPGLRDTQLAVIDGGSGLAAPLVAALASRGIAAHVHTTPEPGCRAVILLGGMRPFADEEDAIDANREAFRLVRSAASGLADSGLLVLTQDTGGDFGLGGSAGARAWSGGLAGLARTAAKEWPGTQIKVIDCERGERSPEVVAEALAEELTRGGAGGSGSEVGLRADGSRWMLQERLERAPTAARRQAPTGARPVIVVTGGARGVTAAALLAMARSDHPAFVLLGRTELSDEPTDLSGITEVQELRRRIAARGLPGGPAAIGAEATRVLAVREARETIAALEAAGAAVSYAAVDVRDGEALTKTLQGARDRFGPITGLIHAAGILADATIANKADEQFDAVFDTKVVGLRALLAATTTDPLDLVCLFSSVSGRFGNAGQSDYAMANEVLAQVASTVAADRPDCSVRSIAWGPWDGGMVTPTLRDHFGGLGVPLIPVAAGASAFVDEIAAGPSSPRVCLFAGEQPDPLGGPVTGGTRLLGDFQIDSDTHPYLADHVIASVPVLPMAVVADRMLAAASGSFLEGQPTPILRDLEVIQGVVLPQFTGAGHLVGVRALLPPGNGADGPIGLELVEAGRPHYRVVAEAARSGPGRTWSPPGDLKMREAADWYKGPLLFHGPAFHALTGPVGLGATGAQSRVHGVRSLGKQWPEHGWYSDPGAIDAALQLAVLWAGDTFGGAFLPMTVEEVRVPSPGLIEGTANAVLLAREQDPIRPVCDLALCADDGTALIELCGVALVRRPDVLADERRS